MRLEFENRLTATATETQHLQLRLIAAAYLPRRRRRRRRSWLIGSAAQLYLDLQGAQLQQQLPLHPQGTFPFLVGACPLFIFHARLVIEHQNKDCVQFSSNCQPEWGSALIAPSRGSPRSSRDCAAPNKVK